MSRRYSRGRTWVEWLLKKHENTLRGAGHVKAGHLQWSTNQTTNPPSSWSFLQTVDRYSICDWRWLNPAEECIYGALKVKAENLIIIFFHSCFFKPVWLPFLCRTQKEIFWKMPFVFFFPSLKFSDLFSQLRDKRDKLWNKKLQLPFEFYIASYKLWVIKSLYLNSENFNRFQKWTYCLLFIIFLIRFKQKVL